jgi:biotin carboxyl carrier protein
MSSEYDITIDDRTYRAKVERLDEGGILIVSVGDETYTLKTVENEDGTFSINDTINDYSIKLLKRTSSVLDLELDDEPRSVEWQKVVKVQKVSTPSTSASGPKVAGGVYPPMPGKITEVNVAVGDAVEEGQTVCILEAMKMFNELKAAQSGTVKEVNVEVGSAVTPNDILILIE